MTLPMYPSCPVTRILIESRLPGYAVHQQGYRQSRNEWDGLARPKVLLLRDEVPPASVDGHRGDWHHEPAAPVSDVRHLHHDFLLDVPRQDQNVIGARLGDLVGRVYGDMGARCE